MQLLSGTQGASRLREAFGGLAQAQIHLPWHSQVSSHRHDTLCSVFCPLYPHRPFPIPTVFPSSQALGPIPIPAGQTPSFPLTFWGALRPSRVLLYLDASLHGYVVQFQKQWWYLQLPECNLATGNIGNSGGVYGAGWGSGLRTAGRCWGKVGGGWHCIIPAVDCKVEWTWGCCSSYRFRARS